MPTAVPVYFYIPKALWPNELPSSLDENWAGYGLGLYAWTVQTYLRLRSAGTQCELTSRLPDEGIVICHSNALRSQTINPGPRRLLICMKAESWQSEKATLHIVQNPSETSLAGNCYFVPHWPQPGLIPRDPSRNDAFETVAFFGHEASIAPALRSRAWQFALAERGLRERVVANTNRWNRYSTLDASWNDYHDVDAIIAVRSFNPIRRWVTGRFAYKPATKLYNAWLSGVIAILGAESAYRETGDYKPGAGQNYLEVRSFAALLNTLDKLKGDVSLRRSLVAQGTKEVVEYTAAKTVRKWQVFLEVIAIPAYVEWRGFSPWQRKQALIEARIASYRDRLARKSQTTLLSTLPL
ncbi:MAG: hypothetical protein AAFV85_13315 [Cyanobacteria bacterium J06634_6]